MKPFVTGKNAFCEVGNAGSVARLLEVAEGVDAEQALEKASALMALVTGRLRAVALGDMAFDSGDAWLTLHAAETVKAVVDAVWVGNVRARSSL